ncbi:anion exchange protein 3-like isoform X1 [Saccostrea cucullata]|uniref:anion exchange protein 3-like isoform X1 n=2 Tax=Saccostrea cuccullata TaxID=36930 RepID=UPI002ED6441C
MAFLGRDNHEDLNYNRDQSTGPRQVNSTSFLLNATQELDGEHSHSSPGVLTRSPTAPDMPRQDHSLDHIVDLFDDVQKIFEKYPKFDVTDLSAGSELLASEHVTSRDGDRVIPAKDAMVYTEDDFSSHRSNSFPHIHHPLRPLRSKSHKNVRHSEHHKKKKKKKRRMHVNKSFPSKSAVQSPPIPEDDEDEYCSSYDSSSDSSISRRNSSVSQDLVDAPLVIKEQSDLEPSSSVDLDKALGDVPPEPPTPSPTSTQLEAPRTPERKPSDRKVADFFIGENESSPPRDLTPSVEKKPFPSSFNEVLSQSSSTTEDHFQLLDFGNTEQEPLLSEQAQRKPAGSSRSLLDEGRSRVHFSVGGEDSAANLLSLKGDTESVSSDQSQNKRSRASFHSTGSGKSTKSHRHKRHHDHYKTEDLLLRRQKGSEVHLDMVVKSEPTETDEAQMLHKADLDEMASHRLDKLHGIRRHRLTKNHSAMSSIVHIGKHKKTKHKMFQPKKKFDHRPHEVFVELDELYGDEEKYEWREKARWIKFEEDVEEGAERWGKPHVASLSFHSLLELRRGLENGTMILDLEAEDLPSIVTYVVNDMVIHDHIKSEDKGKVLKTLLMKHKHVGDKLNTFIRRNISYMNLSGLDSSNKRHQKEKLSLRRSLTSASFRSSASLDKMADTPTETLIKKEKEAAEKAKNNEVKNLEFVKVNVDNNMHADGVHIGITTNESRQKNIQDIMRRIPKDAEALTVLVGCVDYLAKPAMAFVRLAEGQVLDNLTEVPLPVRFLFVLLGPENAMDYHEVGRSISTLMANQHFHDIAYKAISRDELLHAINEFLDESIVLPPGDWDQKTLLPIMDMARKKARAMRRKKHKEEEKIALLKKEEEDKIPLDPLKRTGRLFGGLVNDVKRRFPHYLSDFKDALHFQCVASFIFIFFACLSPTIAFGGLLGEKTNKYMGVTETIISTSLSGVLFGLFSAQPMMLLGATGPVLVFEESLYQFCTSYEIEFLPMRFWIGLWVMLITFVVIGLEGSYLVKHITRFTEEIFTIVISLIFIYEVVKKIKATFADHPLMETYTVCNSSTPNISSYNITIVSINETSTKSPITLYENLYSKDQHSYHTQTEPKPNTALLSLVLMLGTFFIAYFLRIFRNSKFLGRSARRALGDFGVVIALFLMVLLDAITPTVYTQKLIISDDFEPTDGSKRGWFVHPMGIKKPMKTDMIIGASLPAFLLFILLFLETQITEMTLNKKEFKMKKGSGYHLDQVLLGVLSFIGGLFGLPWMCAATVRTLCHVSSLSVYSRFHAPGEKPRLVKVREQRVTSIAVNLLLGLSLLWGPLLRLVPMAVLFGIFLYVGVSALSSLQLYRRMKLLFIPNKHHPSIGYVRRVRTIKMHLFTVIQVLMLALMFGLKLSPAAIAFPLFIILLIPVRLKVMNYFFSEQELGELDKEDEDSDFEDEDDRDFYQLAHMPI